MAKRMTSMKIRMRKNRTYGSEGGGSSNIDVMEASTRPGAGTTEEELTAAEVLAAGNLTV